MLWWLGMATAFGSFFCSTDERMRPFSIRSPSIHMSQHLCTFILWFPVLKKFRKKCNEAWESERMQNKKRKRISLCQLNLRLYNYSVQFVDVFFFRSKILVRFNAPKMQLQKFVAIIDLGTQFEVGCCSYVCANRVNKTCVQLNGHSWFVHLLDPAIWLISIMDLIFPFQVEKKKL